MAWTTPGTAVAGDVLTAAFWNEQVRDNMLMGNPVFTNEAARDAAIASPVEGQRCYLTTPTVPAATGGSTFVPTGVTTIYNGSAWVCVTPVGAFTSNQGTTTSTSFTATLSGSPGDNPSVTLVTGTTALIHLRSGMLNSSGGGFSEVSVAVSGASTVSASSDWSITYESSNANDQAFMTQTIILGSLTAGTNTFTLQYQQASGTSTFLRRGIIAQGIA